MGQQKLKEEIAQRLICEGKSYQRINGVLRNLFGKGFSNSILQRMSQQKDLCTCNFTSSTKIEKGSHSCNFTSKSKNENISCAYDITSKVKNEMDNIDWEIRNLSQRKKIFRNFIEGNLDI